MPTFQVTLKERHGQQRTLDCGLYRAPMREAAVKKAKERLRGMVRRLELGDAGWEWVAVQRGTR